MTAAVNVARALVVALSLSIAAAVGYATPAMAAPQLRIVAPADDAWSNSATPLLSGVTDDHLDLLSVSIYAGSSVEGAPLEILPTLLAPLEGSWAVAPLLPLPDGRYTAIAEQTDLELETGVSEPVSFTVDTTPPLVSITAPGALSNEASPTLAGTAGVADGDLSTVTVSIHEGPSLAGTVVAEQTVPVSGGTWSYSPSAKGDGTYTAEVSQEDEAGNIGVSSPLTFVIDTTPPLVTIKSPGAVTKKANTPLSGQAGVAPGDLPDVLVAIHQGSTLAGALVVPAQPATVAGGTWTYTTPTLPEGTYTAQAFQQDEAGNLGHGVPVTFTVDTTPPVVSITSPGFATVIDESRPTFSGTAGVASGDSQTITLKITAEGPGRSEVTTETIKASGSSWTSGSSGPRLRDGLYTVRAEQQDAAENIGVSEPVTFTILTNAPEVSFDEPGITRGEDEQVTDAQPTFTGTRSTGPEDGGTVQVKVYAGTEATGTLVETPPVTVKGADWSASSSTALPDGVYTAQAEQSSFGDEVGISNHVTFTVDGDAPQVAITAPAQGSSLTATPVVLAGSAGEQAGDLQSVTLKLFAGSGVSAQSLQQEVPASVSAGAWSHSLIGLAPGTYTAEALQSDDVGNSSVSPPVTFTLAVPVAAPAPPTASFQWFPAAPHVGEAVSLVSTSTDPSGSVTGFSWGLPEAGLQLPGGSVTQTTFATPGSHVVRLAVTGPSGLSAAVEESIPVSPQPTPLMQPFPIVRIAGSESPQGARITLLTVQAPIGAKVALSCSGKSCPARSVSALASKSQGKSNAGTQLIAFRRFERPLRAGVRLEIRVSRKGQIGKYTRFVIRKGKLPTRLDSCLSPVGTSPIACPSS